MSRTAVIAGAGPLLGAALARKFAAEGCSLALFARSHEFIEDLAAELRADGTDALAADAVAETYWHLVEQDRGRTTELGLRPVGSDSF